MSDEGFGDSKSSTPVENICPQPETPQKLDRVEEEPSNEPPEHEDEDKRVPSWKDLLLDYTQNATLHGVRYITTTTQFSFRRFCSREIFP